MTQRWMRFIFALKKLPLNKNRLFLNAVKSIQGRDQLWKIMAVNLNNLPAKTPPLIRQGLFIFDFRNQVILLDFILVENSAEIIQFMLRGGHRGFPVLPFLNLAVAQEAIHPGIRLP